MSTISASTTSTTAYKVTADTTGTLVLQTGSTPTTAVTIDGSQNVTLAGNITLNNGAADGAQLSLASSGYSNWNIDNYSGNFRWYYNTTEYMRLDASGNLGVGIVPSPWAGGFTAIDIKYGGIAVTSAGSANTEVTHNAYYNGTNWIAKYTGGYGTRYGAGDGGHAWYTSNTTTTGGSAITFTQAMTLDTSGNLLVGATSGSARGYFTQDGTGSSIQTGQTNTSFTGTAVNIRASRNTSNGTYNFIGCAREGVADVLFVRDSGNVVNANNSYGAISDIKLKENISDATPKLAGLMQVRVVNYNFKNEPEHKQLGVIAQEIEQVFPAMVEETVDRDEEGNDLGTTTKSVKYSVFVPMLIKAIQEQQAIIETLTNRIQALENK